MVVSYDLLRFVFATIGQILYLPKDTLILIKSSWKAIQSGSSVFFYSAKGLIFAAQNATDGVNAAINAGNVVKTASIFTRIGKYYMTSDFKVALVTYRVYYRLISYFAMWQHKHRFNRKKLGKDLVNWIKPKIKRNKKILSKLITVIFVIFAAHSLFVHYKGYFQREVA